ncbi:MAG: hypothetical protein OEZ22_12420 [Spirochaetia bacterium]|nr:hypothetical protein [Spirochaetia bacterium]
MKRTINIIFLLNIIFQNCEIAKTFSQLKPLNIVEKYNFQTNQWEKVTSMPHAREGASSIVIDNKIYVLGGETRLNGITDIVEVYDPVEDKWSFVTNMPRARKNFSTAFFENKIYTIGGFNNSGLILEIDIYDVSTNLWSEEVKMIGGNELYSDTEINIDDMKISGISLEQDNELIYIFGCKKTLIYNIILDEWKDYYFAKNKKRFYCNYSIMKKINSNIYIIGGMTCEYSPEPNLHICQLLTDRSICESIGNLPTPRKYFSNVFINDKIYIIGGENEDNSINGNINVYNTQDNLWEKIPSMLTPRAGLTSVIVNDEIYTIGGYYYVKE